MVYENRKFTTAEKLPKHCLQCVENEMEYTQHFLKHHCCTLCRSKATQVFGLVVSDNLI